MGVRRVAAELGGLRGDKVKGAGNACLTTILIAPLTRTPVMPILQLSQGYTAVVDQQDFDLVKEHKWSVDIRPHTMYAINALLGRLHVLIMDPPPGMDVSHKDGNGLNCCRYNMEVTTRAKNIRTTLKPKGTIPYIGVMYSESTNKPFVARLRMPDGSRPSLGQYVTAEEAARAYDRAVLRAYGPTHARNFPYETP